MEGGVFAFNSAPSIAGLPHCASRDADRNVKANKRWWQEIRSLVSLLAFVAGAAFIFRSWQIAILLTAALGVHELGHILAISLFGVDWATGFSIGGAWTLSPRDQRRALSHFVNGVIHLTGPFFNLLYAFLALGIHWALGLNRDYWLRVANLSATVGLINALPIGRVSDGGKAIHRIFSSLDEKKERWLLPAPILWLLSLVWVVVVMPYNLIGTLTLGLIGLWFVVGLLRESLRDDPTEAASSQAMTRNQGFLLISYVVILLLTSTVIILLTPLWLTRDHVFGMVSGLATVIRPVLTWLLEQSQALSRIFFGR